MSNLNYTFDKDFSDFLDHALSKYSETVLQSVIFEQSVFNRLYVEWLVRRNPNALREITDGE